MKPIKSFLTICLVGIVLALIFQRAVKAQNFTFTKIVGTNTPIPGGTGNFTGFDEVALDVEDIAFRGFGSTEQQGCYTLIDGLWSKVADRNTTIPGGTGKFNSFTPPTFDGGDVAFAGEGSASQGSAGQRGLYTDAGGSLMKVADINTAIPDGTGNFEDFDSRHSLDNGSVAFLGIGPSGHQGIYIAEGGLITTVADINTAIPDGSGNFNAFGSPSHDDNSIAFLGIGPSGHQGIYIAEGGLITTVADINTAIPDESGTFEAFGIPSYVGVDIVFVGQRLSPISLKGIYTDTCGRKLSKVADTNTTIPGGTGSFTHFNTYSLHSGKVTFKGLGMSGQEGIYIDTNGSLKKVIDLNDPLDGKTITKIEDLSRAGLSGIRIVFRANFSDGSQGIFVADGGFAFRTELEKEEHYDEFKDSEENLTWVKYTYAYDGFEDDELWFQNSSIYPFHIQFLVCEVEQFSELTNNEYETMFRSSEPPSLAAGSVYWAPRLPHGDFEKPGLLGFEVFDENMPDVPKIVATQAKLKAAVPFADGQLIYVFREQGNYFQYRDMLAEEGVLSTLLSAFVGEDE